MLLTRAGIGPMVFKDCDVVNAVVHAQQVIAFPVHAKNVGHMHFRLQGHGAGVVGALDDDFMNSEALDTPPHLLPAASGLRGTG